MVETNFSLLSQEEIDTLISFLTSKDKQLSNEVLNQASIDKLVKLIQANATNRIKFSYLDSKELSKYKNSDCLTTLGFRTEDEQCVLSFEIQEQNKILQLYITNKSTNKKELLTPKAYPIILFNNFPTKLNIYKPKEAESTFIKLFCFFFMITSYSDYSF